MAPPVAAAAAIPALAAVGSALVRAGGTAAARVGTGQVAKSIMGRGVGGAFRAAQRIASYTGNKKVGRALEVIDAVASRRITSPEQAAHATQTAIDSLRDSIDGIAKYLPSFGHAITVNVRGGPAADLRRIWYLALAACFGRYKRGLSGLWGRSINAQWNITGKEVSITLAYTFTGVLENTGGAMVDETGLSLIQRGPDQVTIGAGFPAWMLTSQQNLSSAVAGWTTLTLAGSGLIGLAAVGGLRAITQTNQSQLEDTKANGTIAKGNQGAAGTTVRTPTQPTRGTVTEGFFIENDRVFDGVGFGGPGVSPAIVNQPFRVRHAPNIFRELPIRIAALANLPGLRVIERLPYRRVTYGQWEPTEYVTRGGAAGYVPVLPDDGRVITTGEKRDFRVQGPKPPADGFSRSNPLAMITAVLGSPGILVAPPIDSTNTLTSQGVYAHKPGEAVNGYERFGVQILGGQAAWNATLSDADNRVLENDDTRNEVPALVTNVTQE